MNEVQRKEYINILSYLSSFNPTSLEIQPSSTIVNDVTNINDLEKFISTLQSKSCKRNIKKALSYMEDNSISFVVKESLNDNELTEAYSLFKEVASHGNFKGRPFEYYKSLQETLPSKVIWYLMMKDGHIILANLAVRDLNTKTSNDLYVGKKMELEEGAISYGLKYLSFKYLNENGYKYYDHWGIYLDPKSPKFGFSEFKLKFEGKIINFLPVFAYSKFVPSFFINFIIKVFSNVNF